MMKFLIGIFVPKDADESSKRNIIGTLSGALGIFLNVILFAGKLAAGIISGSMAITADAFNNLSDAASSIVSIIGFKLASQKPDPEHPFGHGRFEYISGFIVSVLIILMGFEIGKGSFDKILHPEALDSSIIAIVILVVSMLVKFYMYLYNHSYGKRIDSPSMIATATDSRNDIVSTGVVLLAVIVSVYTGINIDAYCGLAVALFILWSGFNTAKDMISPLLGTPPTREFVKKVEDIVMSYEHVIGVHDLIVHDYGPGRLMISLHAEVPGDGDIFELHDEIDNIEKKLNEELECHAIIHMDPIDTKSPLRAELKPKMAEVVKAIDERITLHDFRIVPGDSHTNILFDIVLPHDLIPSEKDILIKIQEGAKNISPNYFTVVEVDYDFVGGLDE